MIRVERGAACLALCVGLLAAPAMAQRARDAGTPDAGAARPAPRRDAAPAPPPRPRRAPAPKRAQAEPAPAPKKARPKPNPRPKPKPKPPPPPARAEDEAIIRQLEMFLLMEMLKDYEILTEEGD